MSIKSFEELARHRELEMLQLQISDEVKLHKIEEMVMGPDNILCATYVAFFEDKTRERLQTVSLWFTEKTVSLHSALISQFNHEKYFEWEKVLKVTNPDFKSWKQLMFSDWRIHRHQAGDEYDGDKYVYMSQEEQDKTNMSNGIRMVSSLFSGNTFVAEPLYVEESE